MERTTQRGDYIKKELYLKSEKITFKKSYYILNRALYKKNKNRKDLYKANRLFLKYIFVLKQFYNQNFTYFQALQKNVTQ